MVTERVRGGKNVGMNLQVVALVVFEDQVGWRRLIVSLGIYVNLEDKGCSISDRCTNKGRDQMLL